MTTDLTTLNDDELLDIQNKLYRAHPEWQTDGPMQGSGPEWRLFQAIVTFRYGLDTGHRAPKEDA